MKSVPIDGGGDELERFSERVFQGASSIESLSPFERRLRWDVLGQTGMSSATALRSGIALSATKLRWERSWSMAIDHAPSALKFMLTRGAGSRMTTNEGETHRVGGGTFHVARAKRPVRLQFDFDDRTDGEYQEHLALEIDRARLAELLGTPVLPAPVERVLSSPQAYASLQLPMVPSFYRLLDEVLYCDARGPSRQLYLEGKGLELMAAMMDELQESERAASPLLAQSDVERLERARRILLARPEAPPSLPELARQAGLNEAKLKAGFRTLFGSSVFGLLRDHRMDEAHRLLRERRYSVTEVASRVGYSNPSKFAAAFRKRFGVAPSAVG